MTDTRAREVEPIRTERLFDMVADLDERLDIGDGPIGRRIFDRVRCGTFEGPRLRGELLSGGGDWALIRSDRTIAIDARATLRTDDGALIQMTYNGRIVIPPDVRPLLADPARRHTVDPTRYYFRSTPLFETGDRRYAWLNEVVAIGYGYLVEGGGVAYRISAVC